MKIYIDFDDVICETAKYFTKIAKELFGIDIPYLQFQFFDLQKTFDLNDTQYDELMKAGHLPENLLNYEETPGASRVINKWVAVFDRPWNRQPELHNDMFVRCENWQAVERYFRDYISVLQ